MILVSGPCRFDLRISGSNKLEMIAIQLINFFRAKFSSAAKCVLPLALALSACADPAEKAAELGALAQSQLQNGDIASAQQTIAEAVSLRDDVVELQLLRGRIELAAESADTAYGAYYNALALDPVNSEALQAVSQLGLSTGNLKQSLDATDRILTMTPNQPNALLVRGLHALVKRRYNDAIEYAERLAATRQLDENARILKARALFLKGDSQGALSQVALQGEPEATDGGAPVSETIALTRLEIFREIRDAPRMEAEFDRLTVMRPGDLGLRLDQANFYYRRGNPGRAAEIMTEVLSNEEPDPGVANEAIRIFGEYGSADLSAAHWQRIAQNGDPRITSQVARYLVTTENYEAAAKLIGVLGGAERKALGARLQAAQGQTRDAIRSANELLSSDATNCDALVAKSVASLAERNFERSVRNGQQAMTECPNDIGAAIVTAQAYTGWEREAGARRVLQQAFANNPQSFVVAQANAEWLVGQDQNRSAVAVMRRFTRDSPASLRGWTYYGELCRQYQPSCATEARAGYANAEDRYGLDLPTGQLQPNGLFGRFVQR
ncbi:tetratricopeptide repeat protein [Qipengyuania atrilutea]|uniref:Tetratricopeptide repeat protein n=1 Tax=Qipengyuania atrilutea TaxID=2744473 RepID=A0A850H6G3_9SPHN|nr:tetratricopeptide repeat protein [Actirhodobacter atriluteus]NVD45752.1 hypothetical protein [Actirhodobacter atriluteus]